jgi:hypothetical protein
MKLTAKDKEAKQLIEKAVEKGVYHKLSSETKALYEHLLWKESAPEPDLFPDINKGGSLITGRRPWEPDPNAWGPHDPDEGKEDPWYR